MSSNIHQSKLSETRNGIFFALAAYASWGLIPIYFKSLAGVGAIEILAHRIVWSAILLLVITGCCGRFSHLRWVFGQRKLLSILVVTTLLIGSNWPVYILAVQRGEILQASLGYFINPLASVLLGRFLLGEQLRPLQWISAALAFAGVFCLAAALARIPWISLFLAISFALYGYFRKQSHAGPLEGLTVETLLLFIPAAGYLVYLALQGGGAFPGSTHINLILPFAGFATSIPLLLFAAAVQRLRLVTIGLMQYIAPTISFLLAIFVYHEPFGRVQLFSFVLIWSGLLLLAVDALRTYSQREPIICEVAQESL
jgi:chloramphenicol-sensitive protein RarD